MRRLLVAALAAALAFTPAGAAVAAAPAPAPAPSGGWSIGTGYLTWRTDRPVPLGGAVVEFWSGRQLLGTPRPAPDRRSFTLPLDQVGSLDDLAVRAGGRRLDDAAPARRTSRHAVPLPDPLPDPLPANPVDPGVPGPFRTVRGEYALDPVALPGLPAKVEMQAVVVAPRGATGRRPVVVFLHGLHDVCHRGDDAVPQQWPCPAGTDAIPSYRGYLPAQELLASQGHVTVSISANGINGQDGPADGGAQARSSLVRLHLAKWAGWTGGDRGGAPVIVRSAPRADLTKVLLVGHSRGGEGVNRAALDTVAPPPAEVDGYRGEPRWTIRGLMLLAPTATGQNPVPDVPSAVVLPGCDGDISNHEGQMYVDGTRGVSTGRAMHSALFMVGANHNFFNTEWTPGQSAAPSVDDWYGDDAVCAPGRPTRLSAAQQQAAGATYIAAAVRLFLTGDDRVRPLLDGTGTRAPSADPARVFSHALGGLRTPVLAADASLQLSGDAALCRPVTTEPERSCMPERGVPDFGLSHFAVLRPVVPEPGRYAAVLTWQSPGRPVRLTPPRPAATGGAPALALRLMVEPNVIGARFDVTVIGGDGRRTALGEVGLNGLPGSEATFSFWAQEVRVPLSGVREIAAVELTPRTAAGRAWLLDAWAWRPGTPGPGPAALPRVDVGTLQVVEGDTGFHDHLVPVTVTGNGEGRVRLFLVDSRTRAVRSWTATVRPGDRSIRVRVWVSGDVLHGRGEARQLLVRAERGVLVGAHRGGVRVIDDDPVPAMTVGSVSARTAEGGTLAWPLRLSAPAETSVFAYAVPRAPAAGAELSSTDVDRSWFGEFAGDVPEPSRPLSRTALGVFAEFPAGETNTLLTVPTITDDEAEPDEFVELHLEETDLPVVTGVVTGG